MHSVKEKKRVCSTTIEKKLNGYVIFKQMKGLLSQEPCSVLVGNEANIIFDNLLDQYHMTTLLSLVKKCTNT